MGAEPAGGGASSGGAGEAAPEEEADALAGRRFGVVFSLRDGPSARLADAAEAFLAGRGAEVSRWPARGAFEVAQFAGWLAESGRVEAVVACANIVRGETSHDRHLGAAVTGALLEIGVRTGAPVGNAVLTVDTAEQAEARSGGGKGNRGEDAARAAAHLLLARSGIAGAPERTRNPGRDLGPPDFSRTSGPSGGR